MQDIIYKLYTPHKLLRQYIHRIWIFESKFEIPNDDLKLITPNGEIKLVIMYRSNVKCKIEGNTWDFCENSFAVVGQTTKAAIIDPKGSFGTIGVEFKPYGVYNFFNIPLNELTNGFFHFNDVFDKVGRELNKRLSDSANVDEKIHILERFLLERLYTSNMDSSFINYAVNQITSKNGLVNINEVAQYAGYSKRHLDRKFKELIGVSPKELANIIRFQSIFNKITTGTTPIKEYLYDYYYDQSHFIKEFKRFTGLSSMDYFSRDNKFAKTFSEV